MDLKNDSRRLLITGGAGLLGRKLLQFAATKRFDIWGTYYRQLLPGELAQAVPVDISEQNSVIALITRLQPAIVIHTAAFTGVDQCEQDPELAYRINVVGTKNLAVACERAGSRMVHISADYVFDGNQGNYSETDPVQPVNVYGKTKAQAEEIVAKTVREHIIIRTSIHGWRVQKPSFSSWILGKLRENQRIMGITDQFSSLMYAGDLADAILDLMETDFQGVIHIGSCERISKCDFAVTLASVFELNDGLINPCKGESMTEWKAMRPRDVSLNVDLAQEILGRKLPTILQGLERMKREQPEA